MSNSPSHWVSNDVLTLLFRACTYTVSSASLVITSSHLQGRMRSVWILVSTMLVVMSKSIVMFSSEGNTISESELLEPSDFWLLMWSAPSYHASTIGSPSLGPPSLGWGWCLPPVHDLHTTTEHTDLCARGHCLAYSGDYQDMQSPKMAAD